MKYTTIAYTLATLLISAYLPAAAQDRVTIEGTPYSTVEINGQTYYLKDSDRRARTNRSADASASSQGLYTGDVVRRNTADPELKLSGSLLVRATEEEAKDLVSRYGLVLKHHIGGVALLEASSSTDLNQLASRLRQEGRDVELDIAAPLPLPN